MHKEHEVHQRHRDACQALRRVSPSVLDAVVTQFSERTFADPAGMLAIGIPEETVAYLTIQNPRHPRHSGLPKGGLCIDTLALLQLFYESTGLIEVVTLPPDVAPDSKYRLLRQNLVSLCTLIRELEGLTQSIEQLQTQLKSLSAEKMWVSPKPSLSARESSAGHAKVGP